MIAILDGRLDGRLDVWTSGRTSVTRVDCTKTVEASLCDERPSVRPDVRLDVRPDVRPELRSHIRAIAYMLSRAKTGHYNLN